MKSEKQIRKELEEIEIEINELNRMADTIIWVLKGFNPKPKSKKKKIFAETYLKEKPKRKRGRPKKKDQKKLIEKYSKIKVNDKDLEDED